MATSPSSSSPGQAPDAAEGFRRARLAEWAAVTLAAAAAATIVDAVLLQIRRSYFTGGFLSQDHVTSALQGVAFFLGSLLSDAAVAGVLVALTLWACARFSVRRSVSLAAAIVVATAPIVAADLIEYQIVAYLGDAFDLSLLFELAGQDPREILAVSSAHLAPLAWLGGGLALACLVVVWRMVRRPRPAVPGAYGGRVSLLRALAYPLVLLLVGAAVTASLRSSSDVLDNGLRRKPTGRILGAAVGVISDFDRDGVGALGRPGDPDLFDARIRPYAVDIPGNGVDEDGVGGDLPAFGDPYVEGPDRVSQWASKPDVILVVLESFRADALGARVEGRPVTPVLDELAAQGISAAAAYSHNGYTAQSRWHIFSGSMVGIRGDTTLIDDFKMHGYETAYFSAQDESFGNAEATVGFNRVDVAYDARRDRERRYTTFSTPGSLAVPYNVLEERVDAFLEARRTDRPLFLYVNFHDTHFPYHHSSLQPLVSRPVLSQADITPENAGTLRAMYLNTAANVDRAVGRVLARARQALGREPGVIVIADHGESLFDEGFLGHGYALNDAQTRIPLIVANLPVTIEEPFGQADLRDAVNAALERSVDAGKAPTLVRNPARAVFQYLGRIHRPAQIGFVGANERIVYDFRERVVRLGAGPWRPPEALGGAEHASFLRLVHTWERMMLAREAKARRSSF